MNLNKLSCSPNNHNGIQQVLKFAIEVGPWMTPGHFVSDEIAKMVSKVDHISIPVSFEFVTSVEDTLKASGFNCRVFDSKIASKEFDNNLTIMSAHNKAISLEIMFGYKTLFPPPHIALLLKDKYYFNEIIETLAEVGVGPPPFMSNGPMKNEKENVSILYMDGGPIRLEFISRD